MKELVFLLEEPSAQDMLKGLVPRLLPNGVGFRCIPFQGKQDLEKQLLRKIRGYQNPEARFIVMRDLDNHPDCQALKEQLLEKCRESGKASVTLVRLACKELESFYLADLAAFARDHAGEGYTTRSDLAGSFFVARGFLRDWAATHLTAKACRSDRRLSRSMPLGVRL